MTRAAHRPPRRPSGTLVHAGGLIELLRYREEPPALVSAFLVKYYGTAAGQSLFGPLHTVTSKDRFALVAIAGEQYRIADIGMRMLTPRELFRAQGFRDDYRINIEFDGRPFTKTSQIRMAGNSVCPPMSAVLVNANLAGGQRRLLMTA